MDKKQRIFIISFLAPTFLFFMLFFGYPIIKAFYISFFKWSGLTMDKTFVGFDNFIRLLGDEVVLKSLLHNLIMLFYSTIFTFTLAMFFAVVLVKLNLREAKFYRTVFLFPNVLSIVVISTIWSFIYNPTFGILNELLRMVGLGELARAWLGNEKTVLGALIAPQVWMATGFFMVLYIAGMKSIPGSYYESAKIDGASEVKQFTKITLPMMWEIIRVSLIFFVARAFKATFPLVYITTKGGPNRASELLSTYLYEQAFELSSFGYGTTIGLLLFVVMMTISKLLQRLTARETYEF